MSEEIKMATYEIQLDSPDYFVVIEAPDNATEHQLLDLAINEMTRKTSIWVVRKIKNEDL